MVFNVVLEEYDLFTLKNTKDQIKAFGAVWDPRACAVDIIEIYSLCSGTAILLWTRTKAFQYIRIF